MRQVIHVGANDGGEAETYAAHGVPVLWIEADPDVYPRLVEHVARFPNQRTVQALITNEHGSRYQYHRASNDGKSSSIYPFARHADAWPSVHHAETITLTSTTLDRLLEDERVCASRSMIVIDVQGAEALVLRGAQRALSLARTVCVEVADFDAYTGGATESEIVALLDGYDEIMRERFMHVPGIGGYYNVGYRNRRVAA